MEPIVDTAQGKLQGEDAHVFAWPTPIFDGKLGACHALERRPTMILDTPSRVEDDPDGAEGELWDGVL